MNKFTANFLLFFLLCFFLCSCDCFSNEIRAKNSVVYQMETVNADEQAPWIVENITHYDGIYIMEEGTGSGVIHLWAYLADQKVKIRFSGFVMISDDMLEKPNVTSFEGMKFISRNTIIGNNKISIKPLKIKIGQSEKWIEGVVYNGIFFKKRE